MNATDFEAAFAAVIGHEGGFTDRRSDPGNWTGGRVGAGTLKGTKYGISAASYPYEDIAGMTPAVAKMIYFRDYWKPSGAYACPRGISYAVFDSAVNNGRINAAKFLQRAAGVLADGIVGPKTLAAVRIAANKDPRKLLKEFQAQRTWHHMKLDKMDDEYGLGWSRRLMDVLITAYDLMEK